MRIVKSLRLRLPNESGLVRCIMEVLATGEWTLFRHDTGEVIAWRP